MAQGTINKDMNTIETRVTQPRQNYKPCIDTTEIPPSNSRDECHILYHTQKHTHITKTCYTHGYNIFQSFLARLHNIVYRLHKLMNNVFSPG